MREHFGIGTKRRAFQQRTSHGICEYVFRKHINPHKTKRIPKKVSFVNSGDVLLSRAVAHQVSSALKSLTTVFGMGTGVTSLLLPPNICQTPCGVLTLSFVSQKLNQRSFRILLFILLFFMAYSIMFRSSPRPISIGQLNALPHLHLRPINHIVYVGSY